MFQKQHVAFSKASTKSLRYAYLMHILTRKKKINGCVPPAYVSCQISAAIVTQQVGNCHRSLQRLEQGCHTLYRSLFVWLILTGPIHHCWARWLSPQHSHRKRSNFFHGMNAHTLRSTSSGLLPFSLHVSFVPLYSFISICLSALVPLCCLSVYLFLSSVVFLLSALLHVSFRLFTYFILFQHVLLLFTLSQQSP